MLLGCTGKWNFTRRSAACALLLAGCSRSELGGPLGGTELSPARSDTGDACLGDLDCGEVDLCAPVGCIRGACTPLPPVVCDDGDECSVDRCDPETGRCEFVDLTFDRDGDGHRGPRPGFEPGAPGSCGSDCDDTSASAFPGGTERCDGLDNDCNGIVDEDAAYSPVLEEPVLVAEGAERSTVGGLVYNGSVYAATFDSKFVAWENTFKVLDRNGNTVVGATPITRLNSDANTGPVLWTGDRFGTVWSDRREGDFEIFFNQLDAEGEKFAPDLRITEAEEFSLGPDMIYNGAEYVLVWSDRRNGRDDYRIYGQRVAVSGTLVGSNVMLTEGGWNAEGASLAKGAVGLGLSFNFEGVGGVRQVGFRIVSSDLSRLGDVVVLGQENAVSASVVFSGDRYVVAWGLRDGAPGDAIYGAALDEEGNLLVQPKKLTSSVAFARSHSMLTLGDRLVLFWAAEQAGTYDIHTKMLSNALDEISAEERVTNSPRDASQPVAAFGPDGDIGVLYEDRILGTEQVFFTRLTCRPNAAGALEAP